MEIIILNLRGTLKPSVLLFFLLTLSSWDHAIYEEVTDAKDYIPKPHKGYIIKPYYYSLSYSNTDRQPEFVYYFLSPLSINGRTARSDDFREDPMVKSNPVGGSDYNGSGFDCGHLCPTGDSLKDMILEYQIKIF